MGSSLLGAGGLAVAGPLAGSVGAVIGSAADAAVRRPRSLAAGEPWVAQSSHYGAAVPRLFGCNRSAGLLLWATPMRRSGGGKSGGQRSYVMSVVFALSSRKVDRIGRIWADGREIRDAAGRFESPMVMRLHSAFAGRTDDPLLEMMRADEGSPDYRGLSILCFEDFPLAAFGNRLPQLEFEVIADDGDRRAGEWLVDLAGGDASAEASPVAVDGMIAVDERVGRDIERLAQAAALRPLRSDGRVGWRAAEALVTIPLADVLESDSGPALDRILVPGEHPASMTIGYSDVSREFLTSEQMVVGPDQRGEVQNIQLPMTLHADAARAIGARLCAEERLASDRLRLALPWRYAGLGVGQLVRLGDRPERWEITRLMIEALAVQVECRRLPVGAVRAVAGDGGQSLPAPLPPAVEADIVIHELPMALNGEGAGAGFWVGAIAPAHWRGVTVSIARGGTWTRVADLREPVVAGELVAALNAGQGLLWDEANDLLVRLRGPDDWLESRNAMAVLAGANHIRVGDEIIQYRRAEALGEQIFRLSGLLRNRLGSAASVGGHAEGARVTLLDPQCMAFVSLSADELGGEQMLLIEGPGEATGGRAVTVRAEGLGVAPLPPCHLRHDRDAGGTLQLRWQARQRDWWPWNADAAAHAQSWLANLLVDGESVASIVTADQHWAVSDGAVLSQIDGSGAAVELVVEALGPGPQHVRQARHRLG